MRQLRVYVDAAPVGTLSEGEDLWRFEYDPAWSASPDAYDLSPALPRSTLLHVDGGSKRPVQWFFDNLLPEETLRLAISGEAHIKGDDAFALLEYLGAESAGSLTMVPPDKPLPAEAERRPLSDAELSARIANLPRMTLATGSAKRISLAGAQHKMVVLLEGGHLFEPVGAAASTHILKPNHDKTDQFPASVANEYVTMRLAKACGLNVPDVWMRYVPEPVYIIERFDRKTVAGRVQRTHIIDACQLLNRARTFKHTTASLEALREVIDACKNKAATRLALFRWLAFNLAVANDDCHLKNLSFHMTSEGVQLAPHYDLLGTGAWTTAAFAEERASWATVEMTVKLPDTRYFRDVTPEAVMLAGRQLGLTESICVRILGEIAGRLPAALAEELQALAARQAAAPEEARRFFAAENRVVRVLQTTIVPEMLQRVLDPADLERVATVPRRRRS